MPNTEERDFTKAEMKAFAKKYEVFLEAQKEVEEFVTFLKEQHDCEGEGWQIGQKGFFRPRGDEEKAIPDAPSAAVSAAVAVSENGKEPVEMKVK